MVFVSSAVASGRGMVDLRKMAQFVAVAEEQHFHRAAERLGMSQPPLTVAMRRLEDELGVQLLERGGKRVLGLTAAGAVFLREARETLRQADLSVQAARDTAAGCLGHVRLGYVGSALYGRLPDTIRDFRTAKPRVDLELREATTAAQLAALREGRLDVGVVIPPLGEHADLALYPFDQDRLCIALARDHALAAKRELTVADLADDAFIMWPMNEGRGFHLQVVRLCANAGFVPQVVQEAHGMHAVLSLVAVGAGVAIVPESMQTFRQDRILYRTIDAPDAAFTLALAVAANAPCVAEFVAMATGR